MEDFEDFQFKEETQKIIGVAMKVHSELGCGFLEAVYQEALEIAFEKFQISFVAQKDLKIQFWGQELKKTYVADFFCFEKVIVEIKAQSVLTGIDEAQLMNYLKATGCKVGLLLNFGSKSLEIRRRSF